MNGEHFMKWLVLFLLHNLHWAVVENILFLLELLNILIVQFFLNSNSIGSLKNEANVQIL